MNCTEILQAGSSAAIAAVAFQHTDNQNRFIAEGVVRLVNAATRLCNCY